MRLAKIAYGLLFVACLPALLLLWAAALEPRVNLPVVRWPRLGWALASGGLALMLAAMRDLWVRGGGLPMNAFPPARYVSRGTYRVVSHPIYVGFSLVCVGVSLAAGSAAGAWIVSPLAVLGCAALVLGHERHALHRRFGADLPRPLLRLPPGDEANPGMADRVSVYLLLFLPWLILYEVVGHLRCGGEFSGYLPFEKRWPVVLWAEPAYASVYPFVFAAPMLAWTRHGLRRFCLAGWIGTALGMLAFLTLPVIAPPRSFTPAGPLGWLLLLERADGVGAHGAFPSFHVFWACLAAWLYARRGRWWARACWAWAVLISVSCLATGMHAVVDVLGGVGLFALSIDAGRAWDSLRRDAERVANSWREWRIGPVRIISHGLYAGLGAALGVALAGSLTGPGHVPALAAVAVCALVGAGLWGQYFVGSPTLLRPFGYYGGVLGAAAGAEIAALLGADFWLLAGALAVAAPWVQAIGRLRCLVQGCCHGRPTDAGGIRYTHPRSRVCRLAGLSGVPVHPTPLYSILANLVVGLFLARLWGLGVAPPLIVGAYLLLAGLARFVEESYRGEPQTPIVAGLRLYQWFAIASTVAGAVVTVLPGGDSAPEADPGWLSPAVGLGVGLLYWFAMGVDFPASNRRFSRLA